MCSERKLTKLAQHTLTLYVPDTLNEYLLRKTSFAVHVLVQTIIVYQNIKPRVLTVTQPCVDRHSAVC